jgi:hypothetical protein
VSHQPEHCQHPVDIPAAQLCHYATRLAARPGCQATAVLCRGGVALCASCDTRRSTLGKGQPAAPLPAAPPDSLLDWITQASARLLSAQAELAAAAARARQHGHSWAAIGTRLGISRQAAQQRFATPSPPPPQPARPAREATAMT